MPRPRKPPAKWIAVALICLAIPPALRATALAAAAGTLFEAAPFVLAAALLPRGRFARAFGMLGCGCGRIGPGALALPAFAICWLAFGPAVALFRAVAAYGIRFATATSRETGASGELRDPLGELAWLAPQAFAGALLAESLRATLPLLAFPPLAMTIVSFAGGALLGILLPCATGAVAIAAGIRSVAPAACAGILVTAGIVTRRGTVPGGERRSARLGLALLALACASSPIVHPRFIVPLGCAAIAAGLAATRPSARTSTRFPAAIPALLALATLAGSPLPDRVPPQTTLDEPYAGEALRFVGAFAPGVTASAPATLVRYTITCCRGHAEARAVRLDRRLAGPAGAWYEASGTLGLEPGGSYVLRVGSARRVTAPADPFAYR